MHAVSSGLSLQRAIAPSPPLIRHQVSSRIPTIAFSAAGRPAPSRRGPAPCQAGAERKAKQSKQLQVPSAPPSRESTTPVEEPAVEEEEEEEAVEASTSVETPVNATDGEAALDRLSPDEIRQQMGELRAASKEAKAKDGIVQGVIDEVGLIKWPSPQSALLNTFLVIAIVAGTSVVLFGVNTGLAELSRIVYAL